VLHGMRGTIDYFCEVIAFPFLFYFFRPRNVIISGDGLISDTQREKILVSGNPFIVSRVRRDYRRGLNW
jgi:hypothetical protein